MSNTDARVEAQRCSPRVCTTQLWRVRFFVVILLMCEDVPFLYGQKLPVCLYDELQARCLPVC
jgi:hypothetical protein